MKIVLTDETLEYVAQLYLDNKDLIHVPFAVFLVRWVEAKERQL